MLGKLILADCLPPPPQPDNERLANQWNSVLGSTALLPSDAALFQQIKAAAPAGGPSPPGAQEEEEDAGADGSEAATGIGMVSWVEQE